MRTFLFTFLRLLTSSNCRICPFKGNSIFRFSSRARFISPSFNRVYL
nr:MAG TPA: hypothetical protein [Caudoviricetes sp.]DAJ95609.1 MAG TPA: hypothetical protein [Caudoviricetes sp.]DAV59853.1 MAG TPA: hypothetical protein [Caudoviricetes sp.]